MTGIRKRLAALLLGSILVIVTAESAMRIVAHLEKPETATPRASAVRIVVLGESTSMRVFEQGHDVSWPAVLEKKLNELPELKSKGQTVHLINLAQAGTSSTLLVDRFEKVVDTLKPDFVISMMGINDRITLRPHRSWLYTNSYLVRFAHWAWVDLSCEECYPVNQEVNTESAAGPWTPEQNLIQSFQLETPSASIQKIDALDARFQEIVDARKNDGLHIAWALWLFEFSLRPDVISAESGHLAATRDHALSLAHKNFTIAQNEVMKRPGSIRVSCAVAMRLRAEQECLDLIFKGLKLGTPLTPDLLNIALIASRGEDPRVLRLLDSAGYQPMPEKEALIGTRNAYLRLDQLVKTRGIHWFAMQYPTGSIGGLQVFFDTLEDQEFLEKYQSFTAIFFREQTAGATPSHRSYISNENFMTIAAGEKKSLYFTDLFARRQKMEFGHTTALGHELIADNALAALTPLLIEKRR